MKFRKVPLRFLGGILFIASVAGLAEAALGASLADETNLLYTVADLNSILAKTKPGAPGAGYYDPHNLALRSLGPRLNITGVYDEAGGMIHEDQTFSGSYRVQIHHRDRSKRGKAGSEETLSCKFVEVSGAINLDDCVPVNGSALKQASIPRDSKGFVRRPIENERLFASLPSEGLKPSEVDAVYLLMIGGNLEQSAALGLKSGLLYHNPVYAPSAFNDKLSQQLEPQRWGTFRKDPLHPMSGVITWKEQRGLIGDPTIPIARFAKAIPANSGMRLVGYYSTIPSATQMAIPLYRNSPNGPVVPNAGPATLYTGKSYTFFADGRFVNESWASLAGAGGASGTSGSNFGGKYLLDGWSVKLSYDDGHSDLLVFCASDNSLTLILIGNQLYLKGKG